MENHYSYICNILLNSSVYGLMQVEISRKNGLESANTQHIMHYQYLPSRAVACANTNSRNAGFQ